MTLNNLNAGVLSSNLVPLDVQYVLLHLIRDKFIGISLPHGPIFLITSVAFGKLSTAGCLIPVAAVMF